MRQDGAGRDPWTLLGIEATDDADSIRSAYVRRLREMQPDRDPEAFQALRAADGERRHQHHAAPLDAAVDDLGEPLGQVLVRVVPVAVRALEQ